MIIYRMKNNPNMKFRHRDSAKLSKEAAAEAKALVNETGVLDKHMKQISGSLRSYDERTKSHIKKIVDMIEQEINIIFGSLDEMGELRLKPEKDKAEEKISALRNNISKWNNTTHTNVLNNILENLKELYDMLVILLNGNAYAFEEKEIINALLTLRACLKYFAEEKSEITEMNYYEDLVARYFS